MKKIKPEKRALHEAYTARINKVIDYIETNIAEGDLSLKRLSSIAGFSQFHFHRIFAAMMGETLNHFIQRVRIEKAAMMLTANPKKNMTEIAFDCGYSGSAQFSRSFRENFGLTPTQWRKDKLYNDESNICQNESNQGKIKSNKWKDNFHAAGYDESKIIRSNDMKNVKPDSIEVKRLPEVTVAYVRYMGPYQGDAALFEKLIGRICSWAGSRDLLRSDTKLICLYHDNPEVTEADKLRVSVCVTVPENAKVDSEIGKMKIEGGSYAVAHFEIDPDQYMDAWNWVYGQWLPESGYQPDEKPTFELYGPDPKDHPLGKHIVDICVPVRPL